MAVGGATRKLTTILVADVAGFSRLTAADEAGTIATLGACRALIDPLLARHGGRIFGAAGDSVLAEFGSVVAAVQAAVDFQLVLRADQAGKREAHRVVYRVGVALGDVIVQGDNLLGDGVNIAARIEGLAEPGGITVAGNVREQVEGKLKVEFDDLGEQALKNIPRPVRTHRVVFTEEALSDLARAVPVPVKKGAARRMASPATIVGVSLAAAASIAIAWMGLLPGSLLPPTAPIATASLPSATPAGLRPALMVLPFANTGSDPEQEYFSDGITEDITTALARFPGFLVAGRNSALQYKGKPVDPRALGRELGVRYVLEGSVRKAGDRLRLNAQLIETATGTHVWAERYDRPMADVFVVQDELSSRVVGTVASNIRRQEGERALAAAPEALEAYELTMRARLLRRIGGTDNNFESRRLAERAIERDPSFAPAYIGLYQTLNNFYTNRLNDEYDAPAMAERMAALAGKAVSLAPDDPNAVVQYALSLTIQGRFDDADTEVDRVLALNSGDPDVLSSAATVACRSGHSEKSVELIQQALQRDPFLSPPTTGHVMAWHLYKLGRPEESVQASRSCLRRSPTQLNCRITMIAILAQTGRVDEAMAEVPELLRQSPEFSISAVYPQRRRTHRNAADADLWADGLRKAGLPE